MGFFSRLIPFSLAFAAILSPRMSRIYNQLRSHTPLAASHSIIIIGIIIAHRLINARSLQVPPRATGPYILAEPCRQILSLLYTTTHPWTTFLPR